MIDSVDYYNVLAIKYQVGVRTITKMRKDYSIIMKCADFVGTNALDKT